MICHPVLLLAGAGAAAAGGEKNAGLVRSLAPVWTCCLPRTGETSNTVYPGASAGATTAAAAGGGERRGAGAGAAGGRHALARCLRLCDAGEEFPYSMYVLTDSGAAPAAAMHSRAAQGCALQVCGRRNCRTMKCCSKNVGHSAAHPRVGGGSAARCSLWTAACLECMPSGRLPCSMRPLLISMCWMPTDACSPPQAGHLTSVMNFALLHTVHSLRCGVHLHLPEHTATLSRCSAAIIPNLSVCRGEAYL